MNAENIKLKSEARRDSIVLVDMNNALSSMTKAVETSQKATAKAEQVAQDNLGLLTECETKIPPLTKEVKKQKFLKWLAIGGIVVAVVLDRVVP